MRSCIRLGEHDSHLGTDDEDQLCLSVNAASCK